MGYDANLEKEFENVSIEKLQKRIDRGEFNNQNYRREAALIVLKDKIYKREEERVNKTLELSRENVNATRRLMLATWGLVIVTIILSLVTLLK